ncbi:hypothetical protein MTO96_034993 [Rhipicephalus appendiculatus]
MSCHRHTKAVGETCGPRSMDQDAGVAQVQGARIPNDNQWPELEGATGCLSGAVVDCLTPCSLTPDGLCHVLREMAAWNEFLFAAQIQLREIPGARGMLALVNFDDPTFYMDQPQDLQGLHSAAAMHHLLKHHQCVASLSIGTLHFQKYIQPLRDALPYSHLKKLRMTCRGSLMTDGLWAALPSLTSLEELDCSFSELL